MASSDVKPVVTLAALYGAGGSVVGPRVAERLGVPFLDRDIPEAVAQRSGLSSDAVAVADERRAISPKTGTRGSRSALHAQATVVEAWIGPSLRTFGIIASAT